MKVYQAEERYESAFSIHNAKYLLAAENESQAREEVEKHVGAKKPYLLNGGLSVIEIFDQERLERLEGRTNLLEEKIQAEAK